MSNEFVTKPDVLVQNLSFSHIREIIVIDDAFERFFYETECIKYNNQEIVFGDIATAQSLNSHLTYTIFVRGN